MPLVYIGVFIGVVAITTFVVSRPIKRGPISWSVFAISLIIAGWIFDFGDILLASVIFVGTLIGLGIANSFFFDAGSRVKKD